MILPLTTRVAEIRTWKAGKVMPCFDQYLPRSGAFDICGRRCSLYVTRMVMYKRTEEERVHQHESANAQTQTQTWTQTHAQTQTQAQT